MFVHRQDAAKDGVGWRVPMALTKREAIDQGVRPLQHRSPEGEDLNGWMLKKIQYLITCPPEDFHKTEFAGKKTDGSLRIRLLGNTSLSSLIEPDEDHENA
jgi:hypothetical protein